MYAPILLFVYNRLSHVKDAVSSLICNPLAKDSDIIIFSDAAKAEDVNDDVMEVRKYIKTISGFKSVRIIERDTNWGLAANIIDGVTRFVNQYGKVIVVEDDLIVAPHFLQFLNDALDVYEDEEKVGHIQACEFTGDVILPDTFLIKWTGSWGWATWKRAWKYFNPDGAFLLNEIKKKNLSYAFDFNGKYGYTKMLRRQTEGKNNSWAIRWNAALFLNDILSLNVGKSLVVNNGFDGSGTNCGGGGLYRSNLFMDKIEVKKILPIQENNAARNAYVHYYAETNSFMAKVVRRIKRTLRGDFGK